MAMKSWADASTDLVADTLDRIKDGMGLYAVGHFPQEAHELVQRDFRRHECNEEDVEAVEHLLEPEQLQLIQTSNSEPVSGVLGIELACRIANERGLDYSTECWWKLDDIKETILDNCRNDS